MKKFIYLSLIIGIGITSCKKEEKDDEVLIHNNNNNYNQNLSDEEKALSGNWEITNIVTESTASGYFASSNPPTIGEVIIDYSNNQHKIEFEQMFNQGAGTSNFTVYGNRNSSTPFDIWDNLNFNFLDKHTIVLGGSAPWDENQLTIYYKNEDVLNAVLVMELTRI